MPPDAPQPADEVDLLVLLDRAIEGDRVAYARVVRLVSSYLGRWRADDFRADWDDIIQEVLVSAAKARDEGRIPNAPALRAFVRQATRFKFVDRIRAQVRKPTTSLGDDVGTDSRDLCWPSEVTEGRALEMRLSIRAALARLEDRQRAAIEAIYLQGHTYEAAAKRTGIPLGTLKRAVRTGMQALREALDDAES